MTRSLKIFLLGGALAASLSAIPAMAQDSYSGDEEVIVRAPRYHAPERSTIGAPIQTVGTSQPVRFDDLDLRTAWGVRRLHDRIEHTARLLCRQLDARYPIPASDSPDCYRNAVDDAMYQADQAIAQAQDGQDDGYRRGYDRSDAPSGYDRSDDRGYNERRPDNYQGPVDRDGNPPPPPSLYDNDNGNDGR
jgi:UrcA family protein